MRARNLESSNYCRRHHPTPSHRRVQRRRYRGPIVGRIRQALKILKPQSPHKLSQGQFRVALSGGAARTRLCECPFSHVVLAMTAATIQAESGEYTASAAMPSMASLRVVRFAIRSPSSLAANTTNQRVA